MSEYTEEERDAAIELLETPIGALLVGKVTPEGAYRKVLIDTQCALTRAEQERDAALKEVEAARPLLNVATVSKGFGFMATQKWRHDRYEWLSRNPAPESEVAK